MLTLLHRGIAVEKKLSHVTPSGAARMVDISAKNPTVREAIAKATVKMQTSTLELVKSNSLKKGDVLAVARVAGIMAAKKVPDLIPLCHTLNIDSVTIDFEIKKSSIGIIATAVSTGKTGVEMEALTAVSVTALTIYDMCKAAEKGITITDIYLESKTGGKSGTYKRKHLSP
ncbi:MAG TPA: cyclic pyranopterin monophosphate synthase MoaC [Dehalococcoidales bacterium]|nr:cyclic pyranopterin monophosphate synthase MoaC [Dehalococcoidales bacterium]